MDLIVLIGQCLFVGLLAGWLIFGVFENLRAPAVNATLVADVMRMSRVAAVYPEIYAEVHRNRCEDPRLHRLAFAAIVACECAVALILTVGTLALALALLGVVPAEPARVIGAMGAVGFAGIWGSFLVGGQWYHYWAGHEGSQMTHFVMTLWGIATFLTLV